MRRRVLRPSFVVTFALGAAANAGCGGGVHGTPPGPDGSIGDGSLGDSSIGDGAIGDSAIGHGAIDCGSNEPGDGSTGSPGCPAEQPCTGAPCDLPSWAMCEYGVFCTASYVVAACQGGIWSVAPCPACCQNPPAPVSDAASDVSEAGPDVHDGGPDGEDQDGSHD